MVLDRYLLRYFLAVVDRGNFSRAAAHCHVSQPTLSVGIAKIERTLGLSLFVRSNQRVELTEAGARFLTHARRIEREFNLALQAMEQAADLPPLRLGVLGSIPGALIASALASTLPQKDWRFELLYGSERELTGHLAKGRLDLALSLVGRGSDRFAELPVATEGYALAISAAHPLAHKQEIAAEELAHEVMIVRRHCEALPEVSRHFTDRGVRPHFALRSTNDERVMQMVAASAGLTVMPESYRQDAVLRPKLIGFGLKRMIGWASSPESEQFLACPLPFMRAVGAALSATSKGP